MKLSYCPCEALSAFSFQFPVTPSWNPFMVPTQRKRNRPDPPLGFGFWCFFIPLALEDDPKLLPFPLKLINVTEEKELEKRAHLQICALPCWVLAVIFVSSLMSIFSVIPNGKVALNYLVCYYQRWLPHWICVYIFFPSNLFYGLLLACYSPFMSPPRNMWNTRNTLLPSYIKIFFIY